MPKGKGFELIARSIPAPKRSSIYREIVTEFLRSRESSVLIAGTDRKPATLVQGLRKAIEADGTNGVKVIQRAEEVYLTKG